MNCDNCKHYRWYWDKCEKWNCTMDFRAVHNCFEPRKTPIRNAMVSGATKKIYTKSEEIY